MHWSRRWPDGARPATTPGLLRASQAPAGAVRPGLPDHHEPGGRRVARGGAVLGGDQPGVPADPDVADRLPLAVDPDPRVRVHRVGRGEPVLAFQGYRGRG